MLRKTAAIELRRTQPAAVLVALHPHRQHGTVGANFAVRRSGARAGGRETTRPRWSHADTCRQRTVP